MAIVSIVLPTFNRTAYLRAAVDSVFAQTFADWEMIVADDGSVDETRDYIRGLADPRVRALWLAHCGNPARVRNAAIRSARGRYLAFLDSDDTWSRDKLEKHLGALRERPDRRWSYSRENRIDGEGRPIADHELARRALPDGWILEALLTHPQYQMAMPSVVAERELVREVGGFDEGQRWCEDLDLFLRLAARSAVVCLSEPLCSVRNHRDHYSGDRAAEYASRIDLYAKMSLRLADPRLRALCRRRRADQSLVLAGIKYDQGDPRAVWRTLGAAWSSAWRYPRWWFGAAKAAARPLVPKLALDAYRRRRR